MMKMTTNKDSGNEPRTMDWEMRPGGMLVQRRLADSDRNSVPPPTIRVRVKYGSTYHEVNISSQATFGELKRMLSGRTGLHHEDQKLYYKDKERDSKAFLDIVGVKEKSKIVLMEDPISQEKRYLEMRRNAKMEKDAKCISEVSLEVDRLAVQVSSLESIISKGGKVVETDVLNLIEKLMNQLLKLDGIMADGDVKLQRKLQVKRVQRYVETLDMLKIKNSMVNSMKQKYSNGQRLAPILEQPPQSVSNGHNHRLPHKHNMEQQQKQEERNSNGNSTSGSEVVVTTKWETFDSLPPPLLISGTSTSSSSSSGGSNNNNNNNSVHPKFNWEFFD